MGARDWFRALQVPVLPVGAAPVVVGSLLGAANQNNLLDLAVMLLVLGSVVLIQAAANLQKGVVESRDLSDAPARPTSALVFDAGAVRRLGLGEIALKRLTLGFFAAGAASGLLVVAIRGDLVLLLLGQLGFVAAYSYSGAPFKLSYRGVGEVSTFLAFGPLMFAGAYYSQHPTLDAGLLMEGSIFGFLAAAISYARYFPPAQEDAKKQKRTPVVRLGPRTAIVPFVLLVVASASIMIMVALAYPWHPDWSPADPNLLAGVAVLPSGAFAALQLRSANSARVEGGVRTTVLLHLAVSSYLLWSAYLALSTLPGAA